MWRALKNITFFFILFFLFSHVFFFRSIKKKVGFFLFFVFFWNNFTDKTCTDRRPLPPTQVVNFKIEDDFVSLMKRLSVGA